MQAGMAMEVDCLVAGLWHYHEFLYKKRVIHFDVMPKPNRG